MRCVKEIDDAAIPDASARRAGKGYKRTRRVKNEERISWKVGYV